MSNSDKEDNDILPDGPESDTGHVKPESGNHDDSAATTAQQGEAAKPNSIEAIKLEDLFDSDDDDEEFPASSAAATSKLESSPEPPPKPSEPATVQIDSDIMHAFYLRLFPFRYFFQWLNHGVKPSPDFGNREFSFTLQNNAVLRYQSFPTAELLRKEILHLKPTRFEIGPIYSTNPRDRKSLRKASRFRPVSKELVFDIDLTDYDDIRTCCTKANICQKCWSFATMAIKVVDAALREDFGFEHILWVYSGRRGAHAWVCDRRARDLPDDRRKAITGYLEAIRGGSQSGKKVNLKRPLHPHIARSLEILKPYFASTILVEQDTFSKPEQAEQLLSLLPDKPLADALRRKWDSAPDRSSVNKWNDIDALAKSTKSRAEQQDGKGRGGASSSNRPIDTKALLEAKQDIALEYTYPRLDAEVGKKLIHLLKSPFVVHPGTGRVCVPIDIRRVEQFDPLRVPTVGELIAEINAWEGGDELRDDDANDVNSNGAAVKDEQMVGDVLPSSTADIDGRGRKVQDYEKTSLKPYIDYFRSFVAGLLKAERTGVGMGKRGREDAEESGASAMEF
ncbi:DNA primase small subunit [Blastomyces dermatitidis ER-3]|uniref:DNA primase n=3 Tax=Blastomyces TaxID=229219 RepID=A0A179UQ94_BLAGS|nr:DNA primase small subunit [Blastomyces gilchristii SLH14081]XP_045277940.1 DNA primase small subunit [Blastomyces dermatitidis ER-3]EEQ91397.2 DNA primase small subunit [Blastomyces dermatitidis ER-3]EGE86754.1 DNA primase small subunit [Blastomyces dermatitidis ATCC 18188]OAT09287.1 DNA primase small subunit [Blastomyces gilchristii SLH14081]